MTQPRTRARRPTRLQQLDEAWVPRLASRMQRFVRAAVDSTRRPGGVGAVVAAFRGEPALAGCIAAVLAAGVLFGIAGEQPDTAGREPSIPVLPSPLPVPTATIGPAPGTAVATYLVRAAYDLRHYGEIAAGRPTYAVVDLRHYETPSQLRQSVAGLTVVRAFARVPSRLPTSVRSVPLTNLSDLETGLQTAGTVAAATAKSYAALLKSLHPQKPSDRVVKRRYAQQRRAALAEARALSQPQTCRCLFAVVVRADAAALTDLSHRPEVRVVDPAPPVVPLTGLTVLPLQPDVTRVVPRTGLLGG